jgi:hypothetical protein
MMSSATHSFGGNVDVTKETPRSGACGECGFDWTTPIPDAIHLVQRAPERIAALFAEGVARNVAEAETRTGTAASGSVRWSPGEYLWHLVDVVRFGTERLWTLALDAGAGFPGWDQDAMAGVRRYDGLSPTVGLRGLGMAVADWVVAAREAPPAATVHLPVLGEMTTEDSIRRNAHEAVHHELDIRRGLGFA